MPRGEPVPSWPRPSACRTGRPSSNRQAEELRERFEAAFWCDDLGHYALALDGDKRPCRVRASNAGQCLFGGIASPERAARVARGLMPPPSSFPAGESERSRRPSARYNPMAYHNGAVWPHDNALIAHGAAGTGCKDLAVRVLTGLFAAGTYFDLNRMPELFCGFDREPGEGPVPYPVACAPQAWAAGLRVPAAASVPGPGRQRRSSGRSGSTNRGCHPSCPELRITNLEVARATVDLLLVRHGDDVGVNVLRRAGDLSVVVAK